MDHYKEMYLALFRAVERSIAALDQEKPALARTLLIQAQQAAEEAYLQHSGEEG